jgi:hemin uptake protein HemP
MNDENIERVSDRLPEAERKPREIHIRELLGDAKEATIIHAGERYRLRITANNKLILTK